MVDVDEEGNFGPRPNPLLTNTEPGKPRGWAPAPFISLALFFLPRTRTLTLAILVSSVPYPHNLL